MYAVNVSERDLYFGHAEDSSSKFRHGKSSSSPTAVHEVGGPPRHEHLHSKSYATRTLFDNEAGTYYTEDVPGGGGDRGREFKSAVYAAATFLVILTYLEDALRTLGAPSNAITYSSRVTGLPWIVSLLVIGAVMLSQLSSLVLLVPHAAYPNVAKHAPSVCIALAVSVVLQPVLFGAFTRELLLLSVVQLGALAILYADGTECVLGRKWEHAGMVMLGGRVALTADLMITCALKVYQELSHIYNVLFYLMPEQETNIQQGIQGAELWHRTESKKHPAYYQHIVDAEKEQRIAAITLFYEKQTAITHNVGTVLVACVFLVAGAMMWLGYRTRVIGIVAACGAFISACVTYPFFNRSDNYEWDLFHFFQSMTTVGGLLFCAAFGPGAISLDEKTKKAR